MSSKIKKTIAFVLTITLIFSTNVINNIFGSFVVFAQNCSFVSNGTAHPDIYYENKRILCMTDGAPNHSNYNYTLSQAPVDYNTGTLEQKRLWWAYMGAFGSYNSSDPPLSKDFFTSPDGSVFVSNDDAKHIAWNHGAAGINAWVDSMALNGFSSLESVPPNCLNPSKVLELASSHNTQETALSIKAIQSGPNVLDTDKMLALMGLGSVDALKQCKLTIIGDSNTQVVWKYDPVTGKDELCFDDIVPRLAGTGIPAPTFQVKVEYPDVYKNLKVTGNIEYFDCDDHASQSLYRANGRITIEPCLFYLTTGKTGTTVTPGDTDGGRGSNDSISVTIYKHKETFESNYNVSLTKKDYETGKDLENSVWQVLEAFDSDDQLSEDETNGGIVEENMNENPTTWDDWQVCGANLTTDKNGGVKHSDHKTYNFEHYYCDGHPEPEPPEDDEDGSEYEALMEEWQDAVDECSDKAAASGGTFHHWVCGSTSTQSEETSYVKSGCRDARNASYNNFINLKYKYTFREFAARDGYTLHNQLIDHCDDVPIEIITTPASEAEKEAEWTLSSNKDIKVSGKKSSSPSKNIVEDDDDDNNVEEEIDEESLTLSFKPNFFSQILTALHLDDLNIFSSYTLEAVPTSHTIASTSDTDTVNDDSLDDYSFDLRDSIATISNSNINNATNSNSILSFSKISKIQAPLKMANRSNSNYINLDKAITDSQASVISKNADIQPGPDDINAHNWVVYDHRTEGEIHINKRDMDLNAQKDGFNSYNETNGDSSLEGAVYGLFAAEDIVHPDTQISDDGTYSGTGVVFNTNDLVSVATTDKNGDASFMSITEKPHSVYDYTTGTIIYTNKAYPVNLYNLDGIRKEYDDEYFGRVYENNLNNNGDYWIGRPLILGSYYVKELSRSEGYELSINNKDNSITNYEVNSITANENVSSPIGNAWISSQIQANVTAPEGSSYNTNSLLNLQTSSINTANGYNVIINGLENNCKLYQINHNIKTQTVQVVKDKYYIDATEAPLYQTANTDSVYKKDINGNNIFDENALKNVPLTTGEMIASKITRAYNGNTPIPSSSTKYNDSYNTDNNLYIKAETEDMLRQMGIDTAKDDNGYSTEAHPVYHLSAPLIKLTINNVSSNGSLIDQILNFFTSHTEYSYGDIEDISVSGSSVIVTIAINIYPLKNPVYDTDDAGNVTAVWLFNNKNTTYYRSVAKKYTGNEILSSNLVNGKMYVNLAPIFEVKDDGSIEDVYTYANPFLCYNIGDTIYDYFYKDGSGNWVGHTPLKRQVIHYEYEDKTITYDDPSPSELLIVNSPTDVTDPVRQTYAYYNTDSKQYIIHVGPGTDISSLITTDFAIAMPNGNITLTAADIEKVGSNNPWFLKAGDSITNSEYAYYVSGIGAGAFVSNDFNVEKSFIRNERLIYNGQLSISADANTSNTPTTVEERIIRQKVEVCKDIEVLEDGTYLNDTYSKVHNENLSVEDVHFGTKIKDWLSSLINGDTSPVTDNSESSNKLPNFRFKAYLKSNLERLYRKENGSIVWLDNNGNEMTPIYEDTNGDGNYDTFNWKYTTAYNGITDDYPEKATVISDGNNITIENTNVLPIFTEVTHNTNSLQTGNISNTTWNNYVAPPQNINASDLIAYSTNQKTNSSPAINSNSILYSHFGLTNTFSPINKINENQNNGYTRILETSLKKVPDGTSEKEIESYDYDKFFDALAVANNDKWDDDMYTSFKNTNEGLYPNNSRMQNYPGQNWYNTFYEMYQKDDNDTAHTLVNTDGNDSDGTAKGDKSTSFKPFSFIRELVFGSEDDYNNYPADTNGTNTENIINTSDFARANAEASDGARQFAIKYYLKDEVAKLLKSNGQNENEVNSASQNYSDAIYDEALFNALIKTYNYLNPFYVYDLDTIYSVEWDSSENGGTDKDFTTLSADTAKENSFVGISTYIPYGTYVVVEQEPQREDTNTDTIGSINDYLNRSYGIDSPKEIMVPTVYNTETANKSNNNYNNFYTYNSNLTSNEQAKNYLIRFNEEWDNRTTNSDKDLRKWVIRSHNNDGDYEVYKYGLDIDKLTGRISDNTNNNSYNYKGFSIAQDTLSPLKDIYNVDHMGQSGLINGTNTDANNNEIGIINGGNPLSNYYSQRIGTNNNGTNGNNTANESFYDGTSLEKRYFYGSISEDSGISNNVPFVGVPNDDNEAGLYYKDNVFTMTGNQTAYEGNYAQMLVPWSIIEAPVQNALTFTGTVNPSLHNTFFTTKLRIEKIDSETGENILSDNAIFALYASSRYTTYKEIENDALLIADENERKHFLSSFKPGDTKFYLEDTLINGSKEFLQAMKATNITPFGKNGTGNMYTGIVKKGTPICLENERIELEDAIGNRTGTMTVLTTLNDVLAVNEDNINDKQYINQNTGYLVTPKPIGAGTYVLAEIKAPDGYVRTNPIAIEVYSDGVKYYEYGDIKGKVTATTYN